MSDFGQCHLCAVLVLVNNKTKIVFKLVVSSEDCFKSVLIFAVSLIESRQ